MKYILYKIDEYLYENTHHHIVSCSENSCFSEPYLYGNELAYKELHKYKDESGEEIKREIIIFLGEGNARIAVLPVKDSKGRQDNDIPNWLIPFQR